MKNKKDLGIGVIGIGMGTSLAMINDDPDSRLEVRGFAAPNAERVREACDQAGVAFGTTDIDELVNRDDIDVVGVFSPDQLHFEHCVAALNAGKHVICTKPLVTKAEDARALAKLVTETGKVFVVGQTMRFDPPFVTAKRFFDDGDLGRTIVAEAHYVHDMRPVFEMTPWRETAPQDFVFGGLCHPIDALRWFLGDVKRVQAFGVRGGISNYPQEDNFLVNMEFVDGTIARVLGTYGVVHQPLTMYGLGLYGSSGSLVAGFGDYVGGEMRVVLDKLPGERELKLEFEPETEGAYGHGQTLIKMLRHLEACIEGTEQPQPSVVDGAKTILVGDAIWRSIRSGGQLTDVESL